MYKLTNFCLLAVVYSAEPAQGQWEVLGVKATQVSTMASHSPLGRSFLQVQSEKAQIKNQTAWTIVINWRELFCVV